MTLVDQHHPRTGVAATCRALGVSRATWYRRRAKVDQPVEVDTRRTHPRRLSEAERKQVLDILCSLEFADRSPRAVYATLLERKIYLCSVRTMYRILAEHRAVRERRPQRRHPDYAVPICCAKAPNEVWTWDITKLAGPGHSWFSLYVILDLYSRYVVRWLLARRESALLATRLVEEAVREHDVEPKALTVHSDRGAPMTSKSMTQLLADLGIERSHSRPRVSNDNPFSESQFKTLKYCPEFPGRFAAFEQAKSWCSLFFDWYNNEHRHEGIALFTPADVFTERHLHLTVVRQHALDQAFETRPDRFVRGRPRAAQVPSEVWINQPTSVTQLSGPSPFGGSQGVWGAGGEAPQGIEAGAAMAG